jgi:hypothetical protein
MSEDGGTRGSEEATVRNYKASDRNSLVVNPVVATADEGLAIVAKGAGGAA